MHHEADCRVALTSLPPYVLPLISYLELFSYPDLFLIEIKIFDKTRGKFLLEIKHDILGDRALSMAAPFLWNILPLPIRQETSIDSFKRSVKTYLFKKAFS